MLVVVLHISSLIWKMFLGEYFYSETVLPEELKLMCSEAENYFLALIYTWGKNSLELKKEKKNIVLPPQQN